MLLLGIILSVCVAAAREIDWSAKELEPYDLSSVRGIYSASRFTHVGGTGGRIEHWYLGLNQTLGDDITGCTPGLNFCGVFAYNGKLDNANSGFGSYGPDYDSVEYKAEQNGPSFVVKKDRAQIVITLRCFEGEDGLLEVSQVKDQTVAVLYTKGACVKEPGKDSDPPKSPSRTEEHWGWFTWVFIFMVLFSSIYIVGGAWFQYSKGNAIDFKSALQEVLQNGVDLLRGMPAFIREIIENFTRRSQSRGEYSAL